MIEILFFWERDCPNCDKAYRAIIEAIRDTGRDVRLRELYLDRNPELVKMYEVRGTPTTVFLKNGDVEGKVLGILTTEGFKEYLGKFIEGPSPLEEREKGPKIWT